VFISKNDRVALTEWKSSDMTGSFPVANANHPEVWRERIASHRIAFQFERMKSCPKTFVDNNHSIFTRRDVSDQDFVRHKYVKILVH
jgi:hypothetical protein